MQIKINSSEDSGLIRTTHSICPVCRIELKADIMRKNGKVLFLKECPKHGDCSVILSPNPEYFTEVSRAYFSLMPENMPCKNIGLTLTPKCNLNCPLCGVVRHLGRQLEPMTLEDVRKIIEENPGKEFISWGMEPTEHPQIEEILRFLKKSKKGGYLLTNGLKFINYDFLRRLKDAGLSYVYLQFDGFDDDIYRLIRGRALLQDKLRALENLKKLNIQTSLEVVLAKDISERQINKIINYAVKNDFIRQIGFLPLVKFGDSDRYNQRIFPIYNEFLQIIENETDGRIKLENLKAFQKLMYVVYRLSKFRRCLWFTSYILIRDKRRQGYRTIDQCMDIKKLEKVIDSYIKDIQRKPRLVWDLKLVFALVPILLNLKTVILFMEFIKFIITGKKLKGLRSNGNFLFITYNEFCDPYKMDLDMSSKYCQDIMAMKTKQNKIVYKQCYKVVVEDCKNS